MLNTFRSLHHLHCKQRGSNESLFPGLPLNHFPQIQFQKALPISKPGRTTWAQQTPDTAPQREQCLGVSVLHEIQDDKLISYSKPAKNCLNIPYEWINKLLSKALATKSSCTPRLLEKLRHASRGRQQTRDQRWAVCACSCSVSVYSRNKRWKYLFEQAYLPAVVAESSETKTGTERRSVTKGPRSLSPLLKSNVGTVFERQLIIWRWSWASSPHSQLLVLAFHSFQQWVTFRHLVSFLLIFFWGKKSPLGKISVRERHM